MLTFETALYASLTCLYIVALMRCCLIGGKTLVAGLCFRTAATWRHDELVVLGQNSRDFSSYFRGAALPLFHRSVVT